MIAWIDYLKDDLQLHQIVIPGSHDAAIYPAVTTIGDSTLSSWFVKAENIICQDRSILDQCKAGSRFFDIRIARHGGRLLAFHAAGDNTSGIFSLGGFGASLTQILDDTYDFINENYTEFVILRISHTTADTGIVNEIKNKHKIKDMLYEAGNPQENLAQTKVRDLRGKAICIFDEKEFKMVIDPPNGIHPFSKYKEVKLLKTGIVTCGEYSNSSKMSTVLEKQIERVKEHNKHPFHDHLFVFYWTKTGGDIEENTKRVRKLGRKDMHGGTHANIGNLKTELLKIGNKLPNVIMYDFVNDVTSQEIIELNKRLNINNWRK